MSELPKRQFQYYWPLLEYYIRFVIRHPDLKPERGEWLVVCMKKWLYQLPDHEWEFLTGLFGYGASSVREGIESQGPELINERWAHLHALEKRLVRYLDI